MLVRLVYRIYYAGNAVETKANRKQMHPVKIKSHQIIPKTKTKIKTSP
jgi:hypothetical protein